ncbi:MAG: hypothetical protein ABIR80_05195, partial [Opitutaceae bacterium]
MNRDPMLPPADEPAAIRALLEALRRQRTLPADLDSHTLAGWLDGTLPPDEAARVEETLLDHPDLRRALATARLAQLETVPAAELDRLVALVPPAPAAAVIAFPASATTKRWHY